MLCQRTIILIQFFSLLLVIMIFSVGADALELTDAERGWIRSHPVVKVRISKKYPPFEFYENGHFQGIAVDYLELLGRKLGVRFEPSVDMDWSGALDSIRQQDGRVDMILVITYDPKRESFLNFTRDYISFPGVIFTRKEGEFVSGTADLAGLKIAMEKGYIDEEYIRRELPQASFFTVETSEQALKAVSTGQADAYMGNVAVGTYLIDKLGLFNLKVAAPASYGEDPYSMAARKDWPELSLILQKALDSITAEEHRFIRNKWLAVRYEHGWQLVDVIRWVLLATLICLAFILQLRRMVRNRTRELQQMHDQLEAMVELRTAELRGAQNQLLIQERMATLGKLTATVSHELRNPLGTISNAMNNIRAALERDNHSLILKSIEVSGRNIQRCDRIIGELLEYGRKGNPVFCSVDVGQLLKSVSDEFSGLETLVLETDFASGTLIFGDEDRLRRAVLNLLTNSQQALENVGRPDRKISLTSRSVGDHVEIIVADNGPGVPAELREKIFEPLFSTKNFGIGLGMSIVKEIVEMHQGHIRLEEPEGGGCRFVLVFPNRNCVNGEGHG